MGGAIAGALGGTAAVPADWRNDVAVASRLDLEAPGLAIAAVAERVHAADRDRRRAHEQAFAELLS
jgi:hypothetical protein